MSRATISPPCQDCGRTRYPHASTCSRTLARRKAARFAGSLSARVLEYVEQEPGATAADVAEDLGVHVNQASWALCALFDGGRLVRDGYKLPRVGVVFAYRVAA